MKRARWLNLALALTVSVTLAGCDDGPIRASSRKANSSALSQAGQKFGSGFLEQQDGSPQVQAGRSIVKDAVAVLQADLDFQIGSSLADDPTFGAEARTAQALGSTATNAQQATTTTMGSANSGSGTGSGSGGSLAELQKQMAEIVKAAEPLIAKVNRGEATEEDRKKLEEYKKRHEELRKKLEGLRPMPPAQPSSQGERPAKPPMPPRVEPGKKPEPPKEHNKPETYIQRPEGGISLTKQESGSPDVAELKRKLEELQAANERLRKEQERLRSQAEHLKAKLEELARKKEEHEKRKKEEFKQSVTRDVIDNGDGTLTYVMKMSTTSKGAKITHEVQKTVDAFDKTLISETSYLEKKLPNGATMKIGRTFKLNDDGSSAATFDSEIVRGEKVKKVSWNKITNPDGSSSAQGTITRPDGSLIRISIEKSADGNVTTVADDERSKVRAEVEKGELDTTAAARITDTGENKVLAEIQIEDTEAVKPDAE